MHYVLPVINLVCVLSLNYIVCVIFNCYLRNLSSYPLSPFARSLSTKLLTTKKSTLSCTIAWYVALKFFLFSDGNSSRNPRKILSAPNKWTLKISTHTRPVYSRLIMRGSSPTFKQMSRCIRNGKTHIWWCSLRNGSTYCITQVPFKNISFLVKAVHY